MGFLLITILRLLYHWFHIPGVLLSVIVMLCFFLFLICAFWVGRKAVRNFQKKKFKYGICCVLLVLYILLSAWKLTYYFDGQTKTVVPELVAEIQAGQIGGINVPQEHYWISRFPFQLQSIFNGLDGSSGVHSRWDGIDDTEIKRHIDKSATYIVSYGQEIESISYNCWDGYDALPGPWNGLVMHPEYHFSEDLQSRVFIYRLPLIPLESEIG